MRKSILFRVSCLSLPGLLLLGACSSTPPAAEKTGSFSVDEFEISYIRGRNLHRFALVSKTDSAQIQCFLDQQLLKEARVDSAKYSDLAKQASTLVASLEEHPAQKSGSPCRTPFYDQDQKLKGDPQH